MRCRQFPTVPRSAAVGTSSPETKRCAVGKTLTMRCRFAQRLFDNLPKDTPLVIDMTNFDGMGTLLYPTFAEFASTRRLLAWAGSTGAKRHFESMRLPSSQVFD